MSRYVNHVVIYVRLEVRNGCALELEVGELTGHRIRLNGRHDDVAFVGHFGVVRTNNEYGRAIDTTVVLNNGLSVEVRLVIKRQGGCVERQRHLDGVFGEVSNSFAVDCQRLKHISRSRFSGREVNLIGLTLTVLSYNLNLGVATTLTGVLDVLFVFRLRIEHGRQIGTRVIDDGVLGLFHIKCGVKHQGLLIDTECA